MKVSIPALILTIIISSSCYADEITCRGEDMKYNASMIKAFNDCLGYAGTTSVWKLRTEEYPCFGRCMMTSHNLVGDDGEHIVLQRVIDFVDTTAPEITQESLRKLLTECVNLHGHKIKASEDPKSCMTFLETGRCFRDTFWEVCTAEK